MVGRCFRCHLNFPEVKSSEIIAPDVKRTADLVQEITAASNEQRIGTEQVNHAVQQLDQVIQQNAGAAEEMASSSEELSDQALSLQEIMTFFKVSETDEDSPTTPVEPVARNQKALPGAFTENHDRQTVKPDTVKGVDLDFDDDKQQEGDLDNEFERF